MKDLLGNEIIWKEVWNVWSPLLIAFVIAFLFGLFIVLFKISRMEKKQ